MEEVTTWRQQLEATIAQVCSEFLELQILAEVASGEKIQKIVATVKESQAEIGNVRFELQLQISELQLKLHPTTPLEFREQFEAAIKI